MVSAVDPLFIVCFGSEPWHGLWQRHQQLMSRLAERGHRIVYVDPTNLLPALRNREIRSQRIEKVDENIIVVRPLFMPLHYRLTILEKVDSLVTTRLINKALHELGSTEPNVLWVYSPYSNFMLGKWPTSSLVYDCVDACDGVFSKDRSNDPAINWLLKREGDLIGEADAVFAVSKGLLERSAHSNDNSHLISNGTSMLSTNGEVPVDIKAIKRPVIGYLGRLGDWVDYDLLSRLAQARPEYSIVLIGPVDCKDDRIKKLAEASNVHFLGTKEYALVPNYIEAFDVCTIPFKLQTLTNLANPVKLFEYASLGKPIVTTPLDGVLEFSDLVYVSDGTNEGFIGEIDSAVAEDDAALRDRRRSMAREHDWDSLAEKIETILKGLPQVHRTMTTKGPGLYASH